MNKQKRCIKDMVLYFCFGIITFFMGTIFLRFFTKNILIDIMGLSTSFSNPVFIIRHKLFLVKMKQILSTFIGPSSIHLLPITIILLVSGCQRKKTDLNPHST